MKQNLLSALLVTCIAAPASAAVNLVKDGSFEDAPIGSNTWQVLQSFNGWYTHSGAGIEVQDNVAGKSSHGNKHVEIDSHNNTTFYQALKTQLNKQYLFSFDYSSRPGTFANTNGLDVFWTNSLNDLSNSNRIASFSGTTQGWTQFNKQVTGSGENFLVFQGTKKSDSYGMYIDNVSVTAPVPEPETYALMGIGLIGLLAARRRKANRH